MTDLEKLKFLIERFGYEKARQEIHANRFKLNEFLAGKGKLGTQVLPRLRAWFTSVESMDRYKAFCEKNKIVKNYDDEPLEDIKAGTSRHGVNRGARSFSTSNNGMESW